MHLAVEYSKDPRIIETLATHIKVDSQDFTGETPLHHAVHFHNIFATKALIQAGASLHIQTNQGDTALHAAIYSKNNLALKILMKAGASPHIRNRRGNTAFQEAIRRLNISAAIIIAKETIKQNKAPKAKKAEKIP